jgi:hypothetical protein
MVIKLIRSLSPFGFLGFDGQRPCQCVTGVMVCFDLQPIGGKLGQFAAQPADDDFQSHFGLLVAQSSLAHFVGQQLISAQPIDRSQGFQLLKRKWIRRQIYPTRQDARADVFHYIELFYNPKLRHNTSGSVSPVEFGNVNPNGSEVSGKSGAIQFLMFTSCAIRVHFMSKTA